MTHTTGRRRPASTVERQSRQRPSTTHGERGTVLILVPTMMLVLLSLGAIAIDLTAIHLSQRAIHRVVSAAADDAAGMIDTRQIQIDGSVRIDAAKAARTITAHLRSASLPGTPRGTPEVAIANDGLSLTVQVVVEVDHILLRSMPGASQSELITVAASARILP